MLRSKNGICTGEEGVGGREDKILKVFTSALCLVIESLNKN